MVHRLLLQRRLLTLALLCPLILSLNGCLKKGSAPIPGSANTFDSNSYLTLVTTDNVIQTTKADLAANKFPSNIVPNIKDALNYLIQAYNVANIAYQGYHTAAMANQATTAQSTAVTNALNNVQTATTKLISAKAGN